MPEMKLKTKKVRGEDGAEIEVGEIREGKPLYLNDAGEEVLGDLPGAIQTIKTRVEEREVYKTRAEAAEMKLKVWEGKDVEAVDRALQLVKDFDNQKLIAADQVKTLREESIREYKEGAERQLREKEEKIGALSEQLDAAGKKSLLADALGYKINEKPVFRQIAVETAVSNFGQHFVRQEDGSYRAFFDPATKQKPVLSKSTFEPAPPAEALKIIVDAHPDRGLFLAGTGSTGSGGPGVPGRGGSKTITRGEFEAMPLESRPAFFKDGGAVADA